MDGLSWVSEQRMEYLAALTFEIAIYWLQNCRHCPSLDSDTPRAT